MLSSPPPPSLYFLCCSILFLLLNLPSTINGQQQQSQQMVPMLANEPLPPSDRLAAAAGGSAPTEEQLISRLLKSPGLPPSGPPALEAAAAVNEGGGAAKPNGLVTDNASMGGENKEQGPSPPAPLPPQLPVVVNSPASIQSIVGSKPHSPPSPPPSFIQCLMQIQARICDPNAILAAKERTEIDETLKELEMATKKENAPDACERGGLQLMVILVRHSSLQGEEMNSVQQKLNDALNGWVRDPAHKCEKPVILMLSADPDMLNRRVWTGRHWAVSVETGEMVKLYFAQEQLTRQEKYAEVILNIVDGMLDRYEKHAFGTVMTAQRQR